MQKKNVLIALLLAILLPAAGIFSYRHYQAYQEAENKRLVFEKRKAAWLGLKEALAKEISGFPGEAGVIIKDLNTGREIFFNKEKLFPSASLAKIPLMAAVLLAAEEGRIKLDRNIALKNADKLSGSGVLKDMPQGTVFSVGKLIGLMIYESDNTATNILTNIAGIDYLNSAFENFGLRNTRLLRKIADYNLRDKGIENYTTAEDMALILEKIYLRTLGNKSVSDQCIRFLKLTRVNDRIPKYLPADITIAHKTGLERGVCHDVGIVFTGKGDFLVVVLTAHTNSNSAASKEFIAKVSLYTYNYFKQLA